MRRPKTPTRLGARGPGNDSGGERVGESWRASSDVLSKGRIQLSGQSPYPWETSALRFIREATPDVDPFQLWELVELPDPHTGRLHEIDCLLLGYSALYLVELKSGPGVYEGDTTDWYRTAPGQPARYMEPPYRLTNLKAKVLKGLLERHTRHLPDVRIPFVQPLVFLSDPEVKLKFHGYGDQCVVTRETFLKAVQFNQFPGNDGGVTRARVTKPQAKAVIEGLQRMGVRPSKGRLWVGSYELGSVVEEGPGYEDRLAQHTEREAFRRRARVYLVPQQTSTERRQMLLRAADREAQLLEDVKGHPHVLGIVDYVVDAPLGPTVLFDHFEGAPLDAFLRHNPDLPFEQRAQLIEQIALALHHCHRKQVIHGALSPSAVLVGKQPDGALDVRLYNFQLGGGGSVSSTVHWSSLASDAWSAYQAPELRHDPRARGPASDLFSLGALAYLILTGTPPGESGAAVDERLSHADALDPRVVDDTVAKKVAEAVEAATDRRPINRVDDVGEWLHAFFLEALTAPEATPEAEVIDPLQAKKGEILGGDLTVVRVLGQGASSRVLEVEREGDGRHLALKVALTPADDVRLAAEGALLRRLRHSRIVQMLEERTLAGRTCLLMALAGQRSLSRELSEEGPPALDYAARFGEELLDALEELEERRVLHRDIKPGNLGVGAVSKSAKHLTLFDFSLAFDLDNPGASDAGLSQLSVGTSVYRDPYLRARGEWDPAADRWSAAVTLHEMLTGVRPGFMPEGTPPWAPEAELSLAAERFDASIRDRLVRFFEKALARDVGQRFDGARNMRRAWERAFEASPRSEWPRPVSTLEPDESTRPSGNPGDRTPETELGAPTPSDAPHSTASPVSGSSAAAASAEPATAEPTATPPSSAEAHTPSGVAAAPTAPAESAREGAAGLDATRSPVWNAAELRAIAPADAIASLPLSSRALNALDRAGLLTAGELLDLPDNRLSAVRGVGRTVAKEILRFRDQWRVVADLSAATGSSAELFFPGYQGADAPLNAPGLVPECARTLEDAGVSTSLALALAPRARVQALVERGLAEASAAGSPVAAPPPPTGAPERRPDDRSHARASIPPNAAVRAQLDALHAELALLHRAATDRQSPTSVEAWLEALLPSQRKRRHNLEVAFGLRVPTLGELDVPLGRAAELLGLTPAALSIALGKAAEGWARHPEYPALRSAVNALVEAALALPVAEAAEQLRARLGTAATADAAVDIAATAEPAPEDDTESEPAAEHTVTTERAPHAAPASDAVQRLPAARAAALVRAVCAVERDQPTGPRWVRVHDRAWLVADAALTGPLRALGKEADRLAARPVLASPGEAARALRAAVEGTRLDRLNDAALTALAAAASQTAARSSRLELYPRGLEPKRALELSSPALTGELSPERLQRLVTQRYPEAAPLPSRPALDELLRPLQLLWQPERSRYERPGSAADTRHSEAYTRLPTLPTLPTAQRAIQPEHVAVHDFEEQVQVALERQGLRVLTASVTYLPEVAARLCERFGLRLVDVNAVLMRHLHGYLQREGIDSDVVHAADRLGSAGSEWPLLLGVVRAVADEVTAELLPLKAPSLLVQLGLLARYELKELLLQIVESALQPDTPASFVLLPGESHGTPLINGALPIPHVGLPHTLPVPLHWLKMPKSAA
jgi:serine/threonine protein kinase